MKLISSGPGLPESSGAGNTAAVLCRTVFTFHSVLPDSLQTWSQIALILPAPRPPASLQLMFGLTLAP